MDVFTEGIFIISKGDDSDLGGLFMRLKNLTVSEIHAQWDIAFFEQYLSDNIVPRSLWWEISPQKGEMQLDEWFEYFNVASLGSFKNFKG